MLSIPPSEGSLAQKKRDEKSKLPYNLLDLQVNRLENSKTGVVWQSSFKDEKILNKHPGSSAVVKENLLAVTRDFNCMPRVCKIIHLIHYIKI